MDRNESVFNTVYLRWEELLHFITPILHGLTTRVSQQCPYHCRVNVGDNWRLDPSE